MHTLAPPDFWQEQKWDFAIAIRTYILTREAVDEISMPPFRNTFVMCYQLQAINVT